MLTCHTQNTLSADQTFTIVFKPTRVVHSWDKLIISIYNPAQCKKPVEHYSWGKGIKKVTTTIQVTLPIKYNNHLLTIKGSNATESAPRAINTLMGGQKISYSIDVLKSLSTQKLRYDISGDTVCALT